MSSEKNVKTTFAKKLSTKKSLRKLSEKKDLRNFVSQKYVLRKTICQNNVREKIACKKMTWIHFNSHDKKYKFNKENKNINVFAFFQKALFQQSIVILLITQKLPKKLSVIRLLFLFHVAV